MNNVSKIIYHPSDIQEENYILPTKTFKTLYTYVAFNILFPKITQQMQKKNPTRVLLLSFANSVEDLVIRCACILLGCSTVTVNWQADSIDDILYKTVESNASIIFVDDVTVSRSDISLDLLSSKLSDYLCTASGIINKNDDNNQNTFCNDKHTIEVITRSSITALIKNSLNHTSEEYHHDCEETQKASLSLPKEAIIVFTSGTTSHPKGARLSLLYAYKKTLKTFIRLLSACRNCLVWKGTHIVNPLHHVNSTIMCFWALFLANALPSYDPNENRSLFLKKLLYSNNVVELHLFERYTTSYWNSLIDIGLNIHKTLGSLCDQSQNYSEKQSLSQFRLVVPLVSRHIDFLTALVRSKVIDHCNLQQALNHPFATLVMGSAPVGPETINNFKFLFGTDKLPIIRFGSTETALQVTGTPLFLVQDIEVMTEIFKQGWVHQFNHQDCPGYCIGFDHIDVVNTDCEPGEPGKLICKGSNSMIDYVNRGLKSPFVYENIVGSYDDDDDDEKNNRDHINSWYIGLGDTGFYLSSNVIPSLSKYPKLRNRKLFFWMSRSCDIVIRGGANYSSAWLSRKLNHWILDHMNLQQNKDYDLALLGLSLKSEHDSSICIIVEFLNDKLKNDPNFHTTFSKALKSDPSVPKLCTPEIILFSKIPKTFKGTIDIQAARNLIIDETQEH